MFYLEGYNRIFWNSSRDFLVWCISTFKWNAGLIIQSTLKRFLWTEAQRKVILSLPPHCAQSVHVKHRSGGTVVGLFGRAWPQLFFHHQKLKSYYVTIVLQFWHVSITPTLLPFAVPQQVNWLCRESGNTSLSSSRNLWQMQMYEQDETARCQILSFFIFGQNQKWVRNKRHPLFYFGIVIEYWWFCFSFSVLFWKMNEWMNDTQIVVSNSQALYLHISQIPPLLTSQAAKVVNGECVYVCMFQTWSSIFLCSWTILFSMPVLSFFRCCAERASIFSCFSRRLACARLNAHWMTMAAARARRNFFLCSQPRTLFWMIMALWCSRNCSG